MKTLQIYIKTDALVRKLGTHDLPHMCNIHLCAISQYWLRIFVAESGEDLSLFGFISLLCWFMCAKANNSDSSMIGQKE